MPANLIDDHGVLLVVFANFNDTALLFPLEDGMEVLYRRGSFVANFARGLGLILFWMALLAALGLTTASFLSFPVAAFSSFGLLIFSIRRQRVETGLRRTAIGARAVSMDHSRAGPVSELSPIEPLIWAASNGRSWRRRGS